MALYKCRNCGFTFVVDVQDTKDMYEVRCPRCESRWVQYVMPFMPGGGAACDKCRRGGGSEGVHG